MNLRPYQEECVESALDALETGQSALIVQPTGTGKTVVFSHIIKRWKHGRVLVLAHREELIRQAASKIHAVTGEHPAIEMADERADTHMFRRERVVVSSIQTQVAGRNEKRRMHRFDPNDFGLIVIDEAHHAVADSYRQVIAHYRGNPQCKILGVTATPDRTDEAALGRVFESVAFVYELQDAVTDGWLVPIVQRSVTVTGLDFSAVHTTAGDLNGKELAELMENERMLHEIATPTLTLAKWKKTLVFCASVKHAERMCEIFNRHRPNSARSVSGETPKDVRAATLRDYSASKFQFLCNVGVFTEGFDEPSIEMIVLARPTKSRSLFAQMVGRGTRPLPGLIDHLSSPDARKAAIAKSRKPNIEIVDFEGNCGKHKLITCADILGGNYDDDVVARASKAAAAANGPVNVQDELEKAKKEIDEEKEIAEHKRRQVRASNASFQTETIDAFNPLDLQPTRERPWDRGRVPTDKMVAMLKKHGVEDAENLTFTQAKQLIQEIVRRFDSDQASYKQARILKKYGYSANVSFTEASQIITAIAQNGWRRPAEQAVGGAAWANTDVGQTSLARIGDGGVSPIRTN